MLSSILINDCVKIYDKVIIVVYIYIESWYISHLEW